MSHPNIVKPHQVGERVTLRDGTQNLLVVDVTSKPVDQYVHKGKVIAQYYGIKVRWNDEGEEQWISMADVL